MMLMGKPIELHISCVQLQKKISGMCVVYVKDEGHLESWVEVGRTPYLRNSFSAEWVENIPIRYKFESQQNVRFDIYCSKDDIGFINNQMNNLNINKLMKPEKPNKHKKDKKNKKNKLPNGNGNKMDPKLFFGTFQTTLGNIMTSPGLTVSGVLSGRYQRMGKIIIRGIDKKKGKEMVRFNLGAQRLPRMDGLIGKADAFFGIYHNQMCVVKSEVIKNNSNPSWRQVSISLAALCGGDPKQPLEIRVFDHNTIRSADLIGKVFTTFEELQTGRPLQLSNGLMNRGQLICQNLNVERKLNFMDYVKGGTEINLTVAIDFGQSNAMQNLHSFQQTQMNQYQRAIYTVGKILEDYDSDKKIGALGFAGTVNGTPSDVFPLAVTEEVDRVEGVLNAYTSSLQRVNFGVGRKRMEPLVLKAMALARQGILSGVQRYQVLLVLTDGNINDLQETKIRMTEASGLPLSVVIVGVGNGNFQEMVQLDNQIFAKRDNKLNHMDQKMKKKQDKLRKKQEKKMKKGKGKHKYQEQNNFMVGNEVDAMLMGVDGNDAMMMNMMGMNATARDIVQFVPFNQVVSMGEMALAREVLGEIPQQLIGYFQNKGIKPKPPRTAQNNHFQQENQAFFQTPVAVNVAPLNPSQVQTGYNDPNAFQPQMGMGSIANPIDPTMGQMQMNNQMYYQQQGMGMMNNQPMNMGMGMQMNQQPQQGMMNNQMGIQMNNQGMGMQMNNQGMMQQPMMQQAFYPQVQQQPMLQKQRLMNVQGITVAQNQRNVQQPMMQQPLMQQGQPQQGMYNNQQQQRLMNVRGVPQAQNQRPTQGQGNVQVVEAFVVQDKQV